VTHFESERGTDIEQLPETIPLKRKGFKRKADHKNARILNKEAPQLLIAGLLYLLINSTTR
jgi:hypothetical protein